MSGLIALAAIMTLLGMILLCEALHPFPGFSETKK